MRCVRWTAFICLAAIVVTGCAGGTIEPAPRASASVPAVKAITATAFHGVVASGNPIATDIGVQMMRDGGNAIDAAVATALALGVLEQYNSGIGGGCFMLIRLKDGTFVALDGRETAPAGASRDMFIRNGKGDTNLSQTGPLAVGIPGSVMVYEYAIKHFGKRQFAKAVEPGAALAENGFACSRSMERMLARHGDALRKLPGSAAAFLKPDGSTCTQGEWIAQPDLAKTYRGIAANGSDYFYKGDFARTVAAWMKSNGGIITEKDFADYQLKLREPLVSTYRGFTLAGFPPPSSGGVHVAEILNILENFDVEALQSQGEANRVHVIAEAMKLAFADRAWWLGDPAFTNVPRGLIDKTYAKQLAAKISMNAVLKDIDHGQPPNATGDLFRKHTTHIAAADAEGNFVALTTTVNTSFGSKVIVPGTGVVLNNQMDDFAIQPGVANHFGLIGSDANAVAPGKRPLSSMSPTIVLKDGQPFMTLGAAGGPKIITQVLQVLFNIIDLQDDLETALRRPRFHQQWSPDKLWIEKTFTSNVLEELKSRGHTLEVIDPEGATQAIMRNRDGSLTAGSEPRSAGKASGY
jgi:gamma-glutamyltranspeptidase/glutathione hydrolase